MMQGTPERLRRRLIGSGALIVVAVGTRQLYIHSAWLAIAYVAFFLCWTWLPLRYRSWRNDLILTAIAATGLLIAAQTPRLLPVATFLIVPLGAFLASHAPPTRWATLSLVGLAIVRVLMSPAGNLNLLGNLITMGGIYFGFYGARLRREARELDKRRLAELERAYAALQSTHEQLMKTTAEAAESRAREERLQIAADIHDGVGHRLTSLIIGLESMEIMLPKDAASAQKRLPGLVTTARQALQEVRQAVHATQDSDDEFGKDDFQQLIEAASRDGGWQADVHWEADPDRWTAPVRLTLFRVLQESLTNILRHAQARHVRIDFASKERSVTLRVADDGLLTHDLTPGFGLNQMRHRCQNLGGRLTWAPQGPHGLVVLAELPWEGDKA
ncbi:MAG: histidine kinase [Firmicutes bacterium]|nr:histidine kinase [Bacillota bacterium]